MQELVKIQVKWFGEKKVNAVDGRELHRFLGVETRFNDWMDRRIYKFNFKENRDFIRYSEMSSEGRGGQNRIEYALSLNMAKELCMVENNDMGKQAREYFIEMEERAKAIPETKPMQLPDWAIEGQGVASFLSRYGAPEHLVAIEESKYIFKIGGPDLSEVVGKLPCCQNIKDEEVMLEPTELASKLGVSSAIMMNRLLADAGLQIKTEDGWVATSLGNNISTRHAWNRNGKSGYNYKWNLEKVKSILETIEN